MDCENCRHNDIKNRKCKLHSIPTYAGEYGSESYSEQKGWLSACRDYEKKAANNHND